MARKKASDKVAVLVPKITGLEYDCHRYHASIPEMLRRYEKAGADYKKIWESHHRQKGSLKGALEILSEWFGTVHLVPRNEVSYATIPPCDVVFSLGGDNHFTYVAHYTESPIIGINSDILTSSGVLLQTTPSRLNRVCDSIVSDSYTIQTWPKIRLEIHNGFQVRTVHAVGDVYIGEAKAYHTSRNTVEFRDGSKKTYRGSGLVIANGVGSTSWIQSVPNHPEPIDRTSHTIIVCARELIGSTESAEFTAVCDSVPVTIKSGCGTQGVLVCDCLEEFEYDFGTGSEVVASSSTRDFVKVIMVK